MTYDLEAVALLQALVKQAPPDALLAFYQRFVELHGQRPRAVEMLHAGYNPRAVRQRSGSWLRFVHSQGHLSGDEMAALEQASDLLNELEVASTMPSTRMVCLRALLNLDAIPGSVSLDALSAEFARVAARNARLRADASVPLDDLAAVRKLLLDVHDRGHGPFRLEGERCVCTVPLDGGLRDAFVPLMDELVEWRLAEHLTGGTEGDFILKVSQTGSGTPMLFLNRAAQPGLPEGWTRLLVDGKTCEGNFVKVALNVVREDKAGANVLPRILRSWFGADAGAPGTLHRVSLRADGDALRMDPVGELRPTAAVVGKHYPREQIPLMFGLDFNSAIWNQGFVKGGQHVFLLVTMDKAGMSKGQEYTDRWVSDDVFEWHSQNRTTQASSDGQLISGHREKGVQVHLFIRDTKRGAFRYEGPMQFAGWEGDGPITVRWRRS